MKAAEPAAAALNKTVIQRLLRCRPALSPSAAATITAASGPYRRSVRKTKLSATVIVVFTRGTLIAIRELMTTVSRNNRQKRKSSLAKGSVQSEWKNIAVPATTTSHMYRFINRCLPIAITQNPKSFLDRVSTESGSDLVSD